MDGQPSIAELTRLGGGREAEVFAWSDGQALRLAHDPARAAQVEREALALAAAHAAGAPDGDRLCHGDFHPANVLDAADGPMVIDWTLAARGDPAADVARTRLLLLGGAVPDYAPLLARKLDRLGRRMLFGAYLHGYRRARALDLTLVRRWEHVCTVARLAEGIDAEREALLMRARKFFRPSRNAMP